MSYYIQQHFWTKEPIPFFKLFDNSNANDIVLISCFNRKPINFNALKNKKWIFYSGERFLLEKNSNVCISFIPDNDQIMSILNIHNNEIASKYDILGINMNNGHYQYEYTSQGTYTLATLPENIKYIQIRDHERFQIELLCNKAGITTLTKQIINEIALYKPLENNWRLLGNKFKNSTHTITELKPKFACFIVSNPRCWERNKIFDMLKLITKKNVDSLGRWKKNIDIIIPDRETENDAYLKLISQYRFMITAENHSLAWYNTEKIYNTFSAGTIPIYWGDPLITNIYNPSCFINIPTYKDKQEQINAIITACERVNDIENNLEEKYHTFFNEDLMINKNMDTILQSNLNTLYNEFHT